MISFIVFPRLNNNQLLLLTLSTRPNDHSRLKVTKRGCCRGTKKSCVHRCPTCRDVVAHLPGINRPIGEWYDQKGVLDNDLTLPIPIAHRVMVSLKY